jgi:hypothetical protein
MSQQQQKTQPDEAREWAKRLKSRDDCHAYGDSPQHTRMTLEPAECDEVASLLESQADRIETLTKALEKISDDCPHHEHDPTDYGYLDNDNKDDIAWESTRRSDSRVGDIARAALTAAGVKTEEK